jgi:hypothetical protein
MGPKAEVGAVDTVWRVGLDEAGYGPNLGPLVLASTACRVAADAPRCLWSHLPAAVRKKEHPDDGRLLIDDSKKVYHGKDGFARLETGVLSVLPAARGLALSDYLTACALGTSADDLADEPWFDATQALPSVVPGDTLTAVRAALADASAAVAWGPVRTVVIPAARFNCLLDEWQVKSGVLATGVIALLRATLDLPGPGAIEIAIDKLGGRHFYTPLIHEAFPDGWARVIREGPDLCEYVVYGLAREIRLRFEPKADGAHLNVALASMAAKYLREVCMAQFNRYWTGRVPGLKPTAGYPVDATRFFAAIRDTLIADGTADRLVWRAK